MRQVVRILCRLVKDTILLIPAYGLLYAIMSFVWWINFYIPTRWRFKLSQKAIFYKTKCLSRFIEEHFPEIISKYMEYIPETTVSADFKIWWFWGQGETEMPLLVRSTLRELKTHNDNINIVSLQNLKDYIDVPVEVIEKVRKGRISWANFSDIIRTNLLYKFGGIWLDATVWVPKKLPIEKLQQMTVYSANANYEVCNKSICFWTSFEYNWSSWCMFANSSKTALFGFVSEIMTAVAKSDNPWPDYVFQDFLIYYAIHNIPGIKEQFDAMKELPCTHRGTLANLMNQPFDQEKYDQICKNDFVFKLSYRANWKAQCENGDKTFYGELICL